MSNIDNINELVLISTDEMTITFTSTEIQKLNENKNTTSINVGKCEYKLKQCYNISEESSLYILKIDIEQKGRHFPFIRYEVYFPLNEGKMEK